MLDQQQLKEWAKKLNLSQQAERVIEQIRFSAPARRVQSRRGNVSGRYPSRKMGVTIQFESHRNELAAIYELEHDSTVIELYDQPPAIKLNWETEAGRRIGIWHTADFFVIRVDSAGYEECKEEKELLRLAEKSPQRYQRDESGGWRCPPGEGYAGELGLYYRLRSSGGIDWVWQRNIQFLEDYLRYDRPPIGTAQSSAVLSVVKDGWGISLDRLMRRLEQLIDRDEIYSLIARGEIYVDLAAAPLINPEDVKVYASREAALAAANLTATSPQLKDRPVSSVTLAVGKTIIWDGTPWRILNLGGTLVALIGDGEALSEVPRLHFENLVKNGSIVGITAKLDKETIRYLNQLHELAGEVEQLFARAEALDELAALAPYEERSNQLKRESGEARADAAKKEKKAERLNRKLEESSEERGQKVRRAVRRGLVEAMAEVEQANDAIKAFGGGYDTGFGTENGAGGRNSLSTKDKLVIAQQVGKSSKLQQIAVVCGRFTRIALQQQKTRVKHPPDEITSITTGNKIERLLPSEIALLADADLEDLFYLRFAERGLMQYDLIGHEPEGQGPIIIAIDESGSMTTDYGGMTGEVWSKAVMLALLSIARLQKRDLAVIHFSGPDDLRLDLFPKGEATPAQVIACASFFFNGGTVFETWMGKALELVDGSQFEKADVICVSDGISDVSPEAQAEWTRRRAERGMRAYGVLIGSNQGDALLDEIGDAVFRLDDLRGDLPALEVIFSAV